MGQTYSRSEVTKNRPVYKLNENERYNIHLTHHLLREIFKGNFSSPVHNVLMTGGWNAKVLDVNAGLGTWLAEMSANYPGCTFIGVNTISDEDGQPFDVDFINADIQKEGLPYNDNSFDLIAMRLCAWEYSEIEWKDIIIKELVRCLKPGGWVELTDFDMNFQNSGPTLVDLFRRISKIDNMKGKNMHIVHKYEELLMETNQMENIQRQTAYLPIGMHGGRLGETALQYYHDLVSNYIPHFGSLLGIPVKDASEVADKICEEANTLNTKAPVIRIIAQKMS